MRSWTPRRALEGEHREVQRPHGSAPTQRIRGIALSAVSPTCVEARRADLVERVGGRVPVLARRRARAVGEVDQVDRRDAGLEERDVVVGDRERVVANGPALPSSSAAATANSCVEVLVGVLLAAGSAGRSRRPCRTGPSPGSAVSGGVPCCAAGARVVDVLAAAAGAVALEVALAAGLLAVEERPAAPRARRGAAAARGRARARTATPEAPSLAPTKPRDRRPWCRSGRRRRPCPGGCRGSVADHVSPRALDRDLREPGVAPARGDQLRGPRAPRPSPAGAGRARPGRSGRRRRDRRRSRPASALAVARTSPQPPHPASSASSAANAVGGGGALPVS